MHKKVFSYLLLPLWLVCIALSNATFAADIEKDLAAELRESRKIVILAAGKLSSGASPATEIVRLKAVAESMRASHQLMLERFKQREEKTTSIGAMAAERQTAVADGFKKALEDYLVLIDAIPADNIVYPATLDTLKALLDSLAPPKKHHIIGSLPYQNLNHPAREPSAAPIIKPAFKGGNRTVSDADTAATSEAPISKEIAELAQSFNWKPIPIYEWLKNNVATEWYWGCMKGAEETLRQMSGNDCDQAALFAALLRSSGFPTRIVRGSIDFFPDIGKAKNLTGLYDPMKIAAFFQKAGIPFKPIIAGGKIDNFIIDHIWVESYIPYANYRGTVEDDTGKTWLGLDTSIKPPGLSRNLPFDFPAFPADSVFDEYLQSVRTDTPLEFVKIKTEDYLHQNLSDKTYQDFLATSAIIPDVLNILPASLQFNAKTITGEYTEIPDELKHKVRFTAKDGTNELFSITLETFNLSNKRVALTYEPETVEDQEIIDSFGGLDNTPAYLVRLRPVLKVDGERMIVAQDGLPMGTEYTLEIALSGPNGTETTSNSQIIGNLSVIGIVAQKATRDTKIAEEDDAETILFKEANSYINRWNKAEDELAAFLKMSLSRPVPTIVTVGGVIDVTLLQGIPHGFEWKGVFIDAGLRRIEAVGSTPGNGKEKSFMRLSALQGSILENRIFEDDFKVDSVSTAKLLQLAKGNGTQLISIDKTNIDTILPTLSFDDAVKQDITNAVNQNLAVTIPQAEIGYQDWSGIGYLKENRETGESGWMLSGEIAGGMTALNKVLWANDSLVNMISLPYSVPANKDPSSVTELKRITDYLKGIAGEYLDRPLMVMAQDDKKHPVQNVPVIFRAVAGGGILQGVDRIGNAIGSPGTEVTVNTGNDGIARVKLTLGEHTSDSPYYVYAVPNSIMVGQNLVSAFTQKRSIAIFTDKAMETLGYPGDTVDLVKVAPSRTDNIFGHVNTYSGPVWVKPVDKRGNAVSNKVVKFSAGTPQSLWAPPLGIDQSVLFFGNGDACPGIATRTCPNTAVELQKTTDSSGAYAGVILGNTENTRYPVIATVKKDRDGDETTDKVAVTFNHTSYPVTEGESGVNRAYLAAVGLQHLDENGNRIDAGIVGIPMASPLETLLFVHEEIDRSIGAFKSKQVTSGKVDYTVYAGGGSASPASATTPTNGVFATTVTPGIVPGVNKIAALASATVPLDRGDTPTLTDITYFRIWGVRPEVLPSQEIYVNRYGYPEADIKLTLSVTPADYQPYSRYLIIYEDGAYMGFVPADKDFALLTQGGARFDIRKKYTAQLVLNWGTKQEIKSGIVPLNVTMLCLIPDYDHNRRIEYADRARALKKDKYYFWVNDDDGNGDTEGTGIPNTRLSTTFNRVNGTRDLVDYFPVQLDIKKLTATYAPGAYTYRLKNADGALSFVLSWLSAAESGKYLTDVSTAQSRANVLTQPITATGLVLDVAQLQVLTGGNDVILLEAWKPTQNPLVLEVSNGSNIVFSTKLNLSIAGVEQMFRHKNLTKEMYQIEQLFPGIIPPAGVLPIAGHPVPNEGMLDRLTVGDFSRPDHFAGFDKDSDNFDAESGKKNDFVHVHGYNVNGQDARGEQTEVFKRLYWSGSRARFWGVTWYGYDSQNDTLAVIARPVVSKRSGNYHVNVRHAFNAGKLLKNFVESKGLGNATVSAHSLGNMVVSTAIQLEMPYYRYVMANPAVAEEAYTPEEAYNDIAITTTGKTNWETNTRFLMYHPLWAYPNGTLSEIGYNPFLWASEWYKLFQNDPLDDRRKLTWRNRFNKVREDKRSFVFFSPTDEAFRPFRYDPTIPGIPQAVENYPKDLNNVPGYEDVVENFSASDPAKLGTFAFAFQELFKGRVDILVDDSFFGGWGFSDDPIYYNCNNILGVCTLLYPLQTNTFLRDFLKTVPLFKKKPNNMYLYSNTPVTLSDAKIEELLANEIPALTFAAGHRGVASIEQKRNIDIRDKYLIKQTTAQWVRRTDKYEWRHSDIFNVAYPYVRLMYDDWVKVMNEGDLQ